MRAIVAACRTKADRFVFGLHLRTAKRCLERVGGMIYLHALSTRERDLETKHSRKPSRRL